MLHFPPERHDCKEHGECPEVLYSPNDWAKTGEFLGANETIGGFQVRGNTFSSAGEQRPLIVLFMQVIETRMNSMFELATQEEIDKLRTATGSTSDGGDKSTESLELEDLDVCTKKTLLSFINLLSGH